MQRLKPEGTVRRVLRSDDLFPLNPPSVLSLVALTLWRRTVPESTTNIMLFLWETNLNTGV